MVLSISAAKTVPTAYKKERYIRIGSSKEKLSEIFLQLHISEKSGRGVPKIIEVYGKGAFEFRQNSIVVTIPFNRIDDEVDAPVTTQVKGSTTQVTTQVNGNDTQVTIQVSDLLGDSERKIIEFCAEPRTLLEIAEFLGFKERKSVRKYRRPLLEQGRIVMTIPDKPNSRFQKYIAIK